MQGAQPARELKVGDKLECYLANGTRSPSLAVYTIKRVNRLSVTLQNQWGTVSWATKQWIAENMRPC